MIGYVEVSKAYWLFDLVKRQIIVWRNVQFDEKSSGVKLLNAASVLLQDALFAAVLDTGSPASLFSPLLGLSNSLPTSTWSSPSELTGPTSSVLTGPPIEKPPSDFWSTWWSELWFTCFLSTLMGCQNDWSHWSWCRRYLSCEWQTRSQKQHADVVLMTHVLETSDPVTYLDVEGWPEWEQAMKVENDSLSKNHTWDLVPGLLGKNIVKCWWVFRTKFTFEGVERHKACLVVKGFSQQEGINYIETFALVAKMKSVQLILSLVARFGWQIH